jgi:hypothetical protein
MALAVGETEKRIKKTPLSSPAVVSWSVALISPWESWPRVANDLPGT